MEPQANDNKQECQENTDSHKEVISDYQNILESAKKSLAYSALFLIVSVIAGSIHLFGFLSSSDLLWLSSTIEYKTILTWGLPITTLLFIAGLLLLILHMKYVGKRLKYIIYALSLFVITMAILLANFKLISLSIFIYILLFAWIFVLTEIIPNVLENEKNHVAKGTLLFFLFIFIMLPSLAAGVYYLGKTEARIMNKGIFSAVAIYDEKPWGVLLNNGSSFVITDLNNTSRIQIVAPNELKFFVQTEEYNSKYRKDSNTSHINKAQDANGTALSFH